MEVVKGVDEDVDYAVSAVAGVGVLVALGKL